MKILYLILITFSLLSSCKNNKELKNNSIKPINQKHLKVKKIFEECSRDSIDMQFTEYKNIKFYTENTLRGSGVVDLIINKNVYILNNDKTLYGTILLNNNEDEPYTIKLPKIIIAREVIPNVEYSVFSFDAEKPETDKNFLIIYINKEKKLISKIDNKYKFESWETYIKSSFVQLTSKVSNSTSEEQMYYYHVLKIKNDSMQIKSVPKSSCDYIEEYKDITKWIKWKEASCKLIEFKFCY